MMVMAGKLTEAQRAVLEALRDGEWHVLEANARTVIALSRRGLIAARSQGAKWNTIATDAGLAILGAAA